MSSDGQLDANGMEVSSGTTNFVHLPIWPSIRLTWLWKFTVAAKVDAILINIDSAPVADPAWQPYNRIPRYRPRPTRIECDNDVPNCPTLPAEAASTPSVVCSDWPN